MYRNVGRKVVDYEAGKNFACKHNMAFFEVITKGGWTDMQMLDVAPCSTLT